MFRRAIALVLTLAVPAGLAGAQTELAKLVPGDLGASDAFGLAVAIDGTVAVVGAPSSDALAKDAGAAYVYENVAGSWQQVARLTASDGQANDAFGSAVAVSDNRVAVGASFHDAVASNAGAAYVFEKLAGVWTETAKLTASDGVGGDRFGVALDMDGGRLVIGAPFGTEFAFNPNTGTVYIFEFNGASWIEIVEIGDSPHGQIGDSFGQSLDLDGDRLLVGSPFAHHGGNNRGRATIFDRVGGVWQQKQTFAVTDPGLPVGPFLHLPLNFDIYLNFMLNAPPVPVVPGSGTLDAQGRATTQFLLPAGLPFAASGLLIHHAVVVFDAGGTPIHITGSWPVSLVV